MENLQIQVGVMETIILFIIYSVYPLEYALAYYRI